MSKKHAARKPGPASTDRARMFAYSAILVVFTLAAYSRVFEHNFLMYDDPLYVTNNATVLGGLSWEGIKRVFSEVAPSNWQPVTILSHQLDVTLFGLFPGAHHATNILLHCVNVVLLLWVLRALTGDVPKSALVAAMFALQPQHVESVAWVAERKDVLSTLFLFLSLLAYVRYTRSKSAANYALVASLFVLGLMAKTMLVTVPPLLLVLDYWPLKRIDFSKPDWRRSALPLVREKVPLFVLTAIFSVVAVAAQSAGGSLQAIDALPLSARVSNAVVSYALYATGVVWPFPLAVFYPHPETTPVWKVAIALLFLIAVTAIAVRLRHSRPFLMAGWCWFLGTLVPVIGIVQIGAQAMADRYTYITTIGLFIMIVWGLSPVFAARFPKALAAGFVILLAYYWVATYAYTKHWANTETLFRHTLAVTTGNYPAHVNLGLYLANNGDFAAAAEQFERATQVEPEATEAWFNLGSMRLFQKDFGRAAQSYRRVIEIAPGDADAHVRLGEALLNLGNRDEAERELRRALELRPDHLEANGLLKALESRTAAS